ncbi:MAG: hypothetical protein R3C58_08595 [Parvularculaceae bacterium]
MTDQTLDVFNVFSEGYAKLKQESMSLRDYLLAARDDAMLYASPAERMVKAIGEPKLVDTSKDPRLARIFSNRTIRHYDAFDGFYGMEDTIERIVSFFRHAAQGLEEKRQIIYLLGPVGGGKSSLAERLKDLMEVHRSMSEGQPKSRAGVRARSASSSRRTEKPPRRQIRHRKAPPDGPDEPLGGQTPRRNSAATSRSSKSCACSRRSCARPRSQKPSRAMKTIRISRRSSARSTSSLSTSLGRHRRLFLFGRALPRPNQGLLNSSRCSKPIKVLHPLLTATQESNYVGTEALGPIPFSSVILAHSTRASGSSSATARTTEAFLDRIPTSSGALLPARHGRAQDL